MRVVQWRRQELTLMPVAVTGLLYVCIATKA